MSNLRILFVLAKSLSAINFSTANLLSITEKRSPYLLEQKIISLY